MDKDLVIRAVIFKRRIDAKNTLDFLSVLSEKGNKILGGF